VSPTFVKVSIRSGDSLPNVERLSKEKAAEKGLPQDARLSQYLRADAVVDLIVETKEQLLRSLAEVVVEGASPKMVDLIYDAIQEREGAVNTYVGEGVAIPHARVDFVDGVALAVARNPDGLPYDLETDEVVRLVVLVVSNVELTDEHVRFLGKVAGSLKEADLRDKILQAKDGAAVRRLLGAPAKGARGKARPLSFLLLSHSKKIARELGATAIIVAMENREELAVLKRTRQRGAFIVASTRRRIVEEAEQIVDRVLLLPQVPVRRHARVRLTALMALARGVVQRGDVVAFLSGNEDGALDTMTIFEMGRNFGRFLAPSGQLLPGLEPVVLERVITLAAEMSIEGREGRSLGCMFVVGDPDKLATHCQQMVMNPFRGYPEDERNILDPTLAETIKEFAAIDGAFVVGGDGLVVSAGTFLRVSQAVELPGGYGSRHRVACALTTMERCLAVVLSQSTGEVAVFKKGEMILNLPRGGAQ
jgi:diadenylate cyclase